MIHTIFSVTLSAFGGSLSFLATAIGLVGVTGGLVGYFAKGRNDAIIKAQAELIDVRDKQISDLKQSNAALSSENKVLDQQNDTLTGLAQGSPQLVALTKEIKNLPQSLTRTILRAMKDKK